MNGFLAMCITGLAIGFGDGKPVEVFQKTSGVLVAVDSIEYIEATNDGSVIHLDSGSRIYTTKSWDAVAKMVSSAARFNVDFVVVYQKKLPPPRIKGRVGKAENKKIEGILK